MSQRRRDKTAHRLFIDAPLLARRPVELTREQSNYTLNVLRLRAGAALLVFNGRDGEWHAELVGAGRKTARLTPLSLARPQTPPGDLHCLFAPLKHARLDYMVQKAVEMGVSHLRPVITARTQVTRVNLERMRANAVEAAEQCGILVIPEIQPECRLDALLEQWPPDRTLIFCDEATEPGGAAAQLAALSGAKRAVLIGPEGGFDPAERRLLLAVNPCLRLSLGPRILRADTAAVAALALVQAMAGDWR